MTRAEEKALALCPEAIEKEEQKLSSKPGDWSQMLSYIASEKEWIARAGKR